jgi:hypothetical protein
VEWVGTNTSPTTSEIKSTNEFNQIAFKRKSAGISIVLFTESDKTNVYKQFALTSQLQLKFVNFHHVKNKPLRLKFQPGLQDDQNKEKNGRRIL